MKLNQSKIIKYLAGLSLLTLIITLAINLSVRQTTVAAQGFEGTPIPTEVVTWKLGGKPGIVRSQNSYQTNTGYNLFSKSNNKYLTYGKQSVGINLVYSASPSDKKIHFVLPDGKEREILTGEPVALGIGGGEAFLRYQNRPVGINLDWSVNPSYEWRIYGASGEKGKPISTEQYIAIGNVNVKPERDFMIFLKRPAAVDLGWTSSPGWWDRLEPVRQAAIKAAKKLLL